MFSDLSDFQHKLTHSGEWSQKDSIIAAILTIENRKNF